MIGAENPEEIALGIMTEMVAERRERTGKKSARFVDHSFH